MTRRIGESNLHDVFFRVVRIEATVSRPLA
jgi:hypothetical protein